MLPIRRAVTKPPQVDAGDLCEVYFVKAGHSYVFRYRQGDERQVIEAMLDAALDPRMILDLEDVRKLVSALGLGSIIYPASGT